MYSGFQFILLIASVLHADGCIATATWTLHSFSAVSNFCLSFVQQFKHGLIYLSYSNRELYPVALYLNFSLVMERLNLAMPT